MYWVFFYIFWYPLKVIVHGKKKVKDALADLTAKIGEKITIRRFTLMVMGEGLEKRNDDFAAEVAAQSKIN